MNGANRPACLQREHAGDAVEDVGLHAAGLALGQNFRRRHQIVGAGILQRDAGIFLLERVFERAHDLIDDQRRVPDDLTFLLGRLDQCRIAAAALPRGQRNDDGKRNAKQPRHCHAFTVAFKSSGVGTNFSIFGGAPFLRMSSSQMRWMRGS